MRFMTQSLAVLFLFAGLAAHAQDLTIVSKETHDGGPPETTVNYISSEHVRMSHGEGKEAIVDFKSGAIPASAWQVPAGYTKIDNPMLRALQAHSRR